MKKNIKKITILATTTASAIGVTTPILINANIMGNAISTNKQQNSSGNFNANDKLTFNGKEYDNLKAAADDYLSSANGNVDYRTYVGDLNFATSVGNPYKTVDLSKLRVKDDSKIESAYKTLTDKYVSNINDAKKTYVKEPIVQWTDNNGRFFDSEQEAKNAMSYDGYTSPISFYEVNDEFRNNKNVKINPLNKKDNDELKRIAIYNAANNGDFSLSRLEAKTNQNYAFSNKEGKSIGEIKNITNSIIQGYVDIIKDGLWLNASIDVKSDVKELPVYTGGSKMEILNTEYATESNPENINKEVSYSQFLNDAKYLVNIDALKEKFDLAGMKPLFGNTDIYKDARMKKDQTIFGGQKYNFLFVNAPQLIAFYYVAFGPDSIGFLGDSSRVNAYFDFGVNQSKFAELMNSNAQFKNQRQEKANETVKKANEYLKTKLLEVTSNQFPTANIDKMISSIQEQAKKLLVEKIIPDNSKVASSAKSITTVEEGLKNVIDQKIIKELNNSFTSTNAGKTIDSEINNILSSIFQTNEDKNKNDAIYTINYNDQPLYWIDKSAFSELYSIDEFKKNPLNTLKNYFLNGVKSSNSSEFVEKFLPKLTNISNSLENKVSDSKPSNIITWNTINEKDSKKNSILQLETKQISVTDQKLDNFKNNFISQSEFSKYYVSDNDLNKALNKKETDDISYLNNKWGTFEAVYQYNKSLQKILTKKEVSPFQQQKLTENTVKDGKEIVSLFNKDKTQKTIRYAEYFDSGFKFNESLSNNDVELIFSEEKKEKLINSTGLNKPTKVLTIKDYDGNILASESVDGTNNEVEKEQLMQNALNKVQVSASSDYIFYKDSENSKILLKNSYNKLNTLKIRGSSGKTIEYGFANYNDMYNYLVDYIKLNSNENDLGSVYPPFEKTNIKTEKIQSVLNKFPNLETVNGLTEEQKFNEFGDAFSITTLNEWKRYIGNGISFVDKNMSLEKHVSFRNKEEKIAVMNVSLNEGYKFLDGTTSFEQEVSYTPTNLPPIEDVPGGTTSNKHSVSITTAIVAPIVFLIVVEIIVLTTVLINKKNNELRLVDYNKFKK